MTWRIRQVPPSGAKVRPVRRTFWIWAAVPTVKASTRSEGRLTETRPSWTGSSMMSRTVSSMPEKSAVDSEVKRDLVVAAPGQALAHHLFDLLGRAAPAPGG